VAFASAAYDVHFSGVIDDWNNLFAAKVVAFKASGQHLDSYFSDVLNLKSAGFHFAR
jgi:hypothetical protein